jgi:uncharacterized protein with FMN-binding domain
MTKKLPLAVFALCLALAACVLEYDVVKHPAWGTAGGTGSGTDTNRYGSVTVALTLANGFITSANVTGTQSNVGADALNAAGALIVQNNTVEFDKISGASYTTASIAKAGLAALGKIPGTGVSAEPEPEPEPPPTPVGESEPNRIPFLTSSGFYTSSSPLTGQGKGVAGEDEDYDAFATANTISVSLTITNGFITAATVTKLTGSEDFTSPNNSKTAADAQNFLKKYNSVGIIDVFSGATYTGTGIMEAAIKALQSDPDITNIH